MEPASVEDLAAFAQRDTWTYEDYREMMQQLYATTDATHKFRQILADMEAAQPSPRGTDALKIGIGRYMLCRFEDALEALGEATDNRDRRFFAALCYESLRQYDKAIEEFDRAKSRGWEGPEPDVHTITCKALSGEVEEARRDFEKLSKALGDSAAEAWYLKGMLGELSGGDPQEISQAYEKALDLKEDYSEVAFRLAYFLDLHGEEEQALELYEQCLEHPPVFANALLNMAVLLEDDGRFDEAASCLRRLLSVIPNHPRGRLFLKDAVASTSMYYDEDQARRIAKRNAVLDIPVTDFELSVRARNCLKKMNIHTLGDLVRTSEAELLGYKNFGETSLKEIKDMLSAKGLRLGQALEEQEGFSASGPTVNLDLGEEDEEEEPAEDDGVLGTSISEIELSVRARRVLEQLNIHTLGELVSHSEAELLGQKNFGQTSLNEIRQRLAEHGLNFRESP